MDPPLVIIFLFKRLPPNKLSLLSEKNGGTRLDYQNPLKWYPFPLAMPWEKAMGYGAQSKVGIKVMNWMTGLGMPDSLPVT